MNPTFGRRSAVLFLAVFYFLVSTGSAFALADRVAPRTKIVAKADFPCAGHGCACDTAGKCRDHCCCFPKTSSGEEDVHPETSGVAAGPLVVKVFAWEAARCQGHSGPEEGFAGARIAPHLPAVPARVSPVSLSQAWEVPGAVRGSSVVVRLSDKVPR